MCKIKNILFSVFVGFFLTPISLSAELKPLQKWMESLVESEKVVGCMAQITQGGKTIFLEAVGDRSPNSEEDLSVDQIVRIYSMSKAITSVAAMQLIERGELGLDDPVALYIPEFSEMQVFVEGKLEPLQRPINIRDLLLHTSGLAYGFSALPELLSHYENTFVEIETLEDAAKKIATLPLAHQPGTTFTYGLNTDVLGRVVEVVAEKDFGVYLQEHIFRPLSMRDTSFSENKIQKYMPIVKHVEGTLVIDTEHYDNPGRIFDPYFESGGGGLWSTLHDYTRLCMSLEQLGMLDGHRILREETVKFMMQNQISPGTDSTGIGWGPRFGIGFVICDGVDTKAGLLGEDRWSWAGAASTFFFIDPSQDLTAVFATQLFPFNRNMNDEFHQVVLESIASE